MVHFRYTLRPPCPTQGMKLMGPGGKGPSRPRTLDFGSRGPGFESLGHRTVGGLAASPSPWLWRWAVSPASGPYT